MKTGDRWSAPVRCASACESARPVAQRDLSSACGAHAYDVSLDKWADEGGGTLDRVGGDCPVDEHHRECLLAPGGCL